MIDPTNTDARKPWLLIAAFVVALLPYALSGVLANPDEPHYIDAGLIMCRTHDWLMPACPNDASLTELKPILTYWILAASYSIFGPSMAAAHLPYLLAATAVIWWTHRLTLLLCSLSSPQVSRNASILSCVFLMCNPFFWLCAIRCTPDIWLCLFLLMSTYGFLGLLVLEGPTRRYALLAYLGLALAILTKGIPALILFGCVVLFAWWNPWREKSWRRLIDVPTMALGTILALSWFVVVIVTHGRHSLDPLFSDSITTRFDRRPLRMMSHAAVVFIVVLVTIAPVAWPVSKLGRSWRKLLPNTVAERSSWGFMTLWTVVTGLATAVTFPMYLRYLLPAIPMLSAMSAIALAKTDTAVVLHCFRRCLQIALMLVGLLVAAVVVLSVQMRFEPWQVAILFALVSAIAVAGLIGLRGSWLQSAQCCGVVSLLGLPLVYLVLSAAARVDLQERITLRLRQEHLDSEPVVGFVGQRGCATRLRLALGPRVNLVQWPDWPAAASPSIIARLDLPDVLVLPLRAADLLPDGYAIQSVGSVFDSSDDGDFLQAFRDGKIGDCIERHRIPYCIAVRQEPRKTAD